MLIFMALSYLLLSTDQYNHRYILLIQKYILSSGWQKAARLESENNLTFNIKYSLLKGAAITLGKVGRLDLLLQASSHMLLLQPKESLQSSTLQHPQHRFLISSSVAIQRNSPVWSPVSFYTTRGRCKGFSLQTTTQACVCNIRRSSEQVVLHLVIHLKFSTCMKLCKTIVLLIFLN